LTTAVHSKPSYLEHQGRFSGLLGWILSTDHKRIGILYLISVSTFFLVAVCLGLLMRLELIAPGKTIMNAQTYNAVFTLHGVIMIFFFVIPGIPAALGNFVMPIQIGARDVAFPRLNLMSWYLYVLGAILVLIALFTGGGPPDTGWTFYAPYSIRTNTNVTLAVTAAFVIGFSSILTGLNFIVTMHRLRAPGMGWFKMPLFPWTLYATGWVQVLATPILGITLALIVLERVFGVGFFDPTKGGDPIMYEHLFWTYSHPAVYIMILPAMGIISEVFTAFSRKVVFGYLFIAFSGMAIAGLGYIVWGHHMFTSGMSEESHWVFSLLTFLVAVPSGIKVFSWVGTMYKGSVVTDTPLLYALSFIFLFSIGGLTGLINGSLSTNIQIHGTYFIVGHFHYVMFGGTGIAFFAGLHYWFPKITGRLYNERAAKIACGLLFVGLNLLYFPMLVLGWEGMPRRYYDYLPKFQTGNVISTVGSWIVATGIIIMVINLLRSTRKGEPAPANPWEGRTLEWTVPSPPPHENFEEIPHITGNPYYRPTGTGEA
jgi:cytochrome c oxidase subunit 1